MAEPHTTARTAETPQEGLPPLRGRAVAVRELRRERFCRSSNLRAGLRRLAARHAVKWPARRPDRDLSRKRWLRELERAVPSRC
jgi:hypothetical protein